MFNMKIPKGEYMWYRGETSLTLQPLLWVPSHMISTNQLTFNYKKNNLYVWHIRPYHDTISHTIEHWLP